MDAIVQENSKDQRERTKYFWQANTLIDLGVIGGSAVASLAPLSLSLSVSHQVLACKYFMRPLRCATGAQRPFSAPRTAEALWKQRPISSAWDANNFQHC